MLIKKLFRTIWHYKAQFISMIIMVFLGVGVFVGFQGEWKSIETDTHEFYESTGFADYRLINKSGYSLAETEKISSISRVNEVSQYVSVKTNESRENDVIAVTVTTNFKVSSFMLLTAKTMIKTPPIQSGFLIYMLKKIISKLEIVFL